MKKLLKGGPNGDAASDMIDDMGWDTEFYEDDDSGYDL